MEWGIGGDLSNSYQVGKSQAVREEMVEQQIERHTHYPPPHRYARVSPLPEEGGKDIIDNLLTNKERCHF